MTDAEKLKESVDKVLKLNKEHTGALLECVKQEDLKKHIDPLAKELQEKLSGEMTKLEGEITKLEALEDAFSTLKQSQGYDKTGKKEEESEKRKAILNDLLRKGTGMQNNQPMDLTVLSKEDQECFSKSLISGSNQDSGFMTINEMANEINRLEKERSPVRSLVTIQTGSGPAWEQPVQTSRFGATRTAETKSRPKTSTGAIQKQVITAEEFYAMPDVSQTMLDDSTFDIVGYLNSEIADEFSITEGVEFVKGSGQLEYRGITTYPDGDAFNKLEQIESKNAGAIALDDFVDLDEKLIPAFQPGAQFLMNRTTRASARKLVDSQGRPLLQTDLPSGGLPQIFGKFIIDVPDMPAIGGAGSGNLSVAFGDFRRSYLVYDRMGIRILRDPYTDKPFVLFYTTKRTGGDVIKHQGIKLLRTK